LAHAASPEASREAAADLAQEISAIREALHRVAEAELRRQRHQLDKLDRNQQNAVEALLFATMNRIAPRAHDLTESAPDADSHRAIAIWRNALAPLTSSRS
jgi:hypothetical protein